MVGRAGAPMDSLTLATRVAIANVVRTLGGNSEALVLIGAHAIYLRTPDFRSAVAPATKDADFVLRPEVLTTIDPLDQVLVSAGYQRKGSDLPGTWVDPTGAELDFMTPGPRRSKRSAPVPPHGQGAIQHVEGAEGCLVDFDLMPLPDVNNVRIRVAGSAGLLIAKLHKVHERIGTPQRDYAKDSFDIYRLLAGTTPDEITSRLKAILASPFGVESAESGLRLLEELFAAGADAPGSLRAGRAAAPARDAEQIALSASLLAREVLSDLGV